MPLRDHFHPPLSVRRHWEAFHGSWATALADSLNANLLPEKCFAEPRVHFGTQIEVDVTTIEEEVPATSSNGPTGGVATATLPAAKVWTPPVADRTMSAQFPDTIEVQVISTEAGPQIVAAVELVSPGNKDRPEARRAFAVKCANYLHRGVGLVVVDIVTDRLTNLHNELIELLEMGIEFQMPPEPLYATAYRPLRRPRGDEIDLWMHRLIVGQPLPVMPLALDKGQCVPLDLETTYMGVCARSRLP